jgi:RNA polymerase-interacting CarD/CdnL/TRCF family regulator
VELAVGELVVYGGHGAGRVVAREKRGLGQARHEVIVLELDGSLTVTLPVTLAHQNLRPLATEREVAGIQRTLRAAAPPAESVWLKRQKATRAKLAAGESIGLAEIVSDGNRRHQGDTGRLSVSERELYMKARRLLANEIALLRDIQPAHADDWITNQLTHAEATA